MKKFYLIPLVLIFGCSSITDITPEETFVKYYGDDGFFNVVDMILTNREVESEGFIVLASRSGDFTIDNAGEEETISDSQDFYVVQIDEQGTALLEKRIDFEGDNIYGFKYPKRISESTNGYLVIGSHNVLKDEETKSIIIWAEVNDNFDQISGWQTVGDTVSNYYGLDISEMSDGGVLVAGYTDENGTNDYYYAKIGGTDDEWERVQSRMASDDQLVRALDIENENFVLIGRTDQPSDDGEGGANIERTVIDPAGLIVNSAVYGLPDDNGQSWDIPREVIEKPNGFTIVGESFGDAELANGGRPFLMNVDLTGAVSTEVFYSDSEDVALGIEAGAYGITRLANNNLMIVGQTDGFDQTEQGKNTNDNGVEVMYFITDQAGEQISEVFQLGLVNGDDAGRKIMSTTDGSVLIAANYDFGGGLQQIAVFKVNVNGELKQ